MPSSSPDVSLLRARADLLRQLRSYFDDRGFIEVQPPCLSRDCVIDAYIDPISVDATQLGISVELPDRLFLQTSPELSMKRMLAAGADSIYSIGPVFRGGESGHHHNIEFTMLEWYEVGGDIDSAIELLGNLAVNVLDRGGFDVVTYRSLFADKLGFDPIDEPVETLTQKVAEVDTELARSIADDRDLMLDVILSHFIQPKLGRTRPVIVRDYPITQAALARVSADDPQCAARFELIADGVELANGYDELLDAEVLVSRAGAANEVRIAAGRPPMVVENSLVAAMRSGLPKCAGVALGVDRLLMLQTGGTSLEKVIALPIAKA